MDDGEVILIAQDKKNQDGSQTYFILDPCPSGGFVDDSPGIELIDLTEEYQVKNTGAIAVLSTNSTGALEITLKKPKEEMDSKNETEMQKLSGDIPSSSENIAIIDMITDDDTNRPVKDEDEEVDVEEISIHDISIENSVTEQKSEPELLDISEGGEDLQQSQNDQDDDAEEGTLYIDDAKCTEHKEELERGLLELDNVEEHIWRQVQNNCQENNANVPRENDITPNTASDKANSTEILPISASSEADDLEIIDYVEGKVNKNTEIVSLTFDVVSGPTGFLVTNKMKTTQEALIHGQVIEVPSGNHTETETNEKDLSDCTNTALTLLELAGSAGSSHKETELKGTEGSQNSDSGRINSLEESDHASEEPTLATLQPVQLDIPVSNVPVPENTNCKLADSERVVPEPAPKAKTDTSSTPKTPARRLSPEDLIQRLKDGDTPRQMLGKESNRGNEPLYRSPLVTPSEIAQEFMDRQLQKNPYTEQNSGDVIFAMKLAHRLATKIVAPDTVPSQHEEEKVETKEEDKSVAMKSQNSSHSSDNESISKTETGDKGSKKNYAISDKIELLKILEDDPDDPSSSDASQIIFEQKVKLERKTSKHAPLIKMHPELEKELALKQLQDFSQGGRGRKRVSFNPDLQNINQEKNHEHNNNMNLVEKQTNGTKKRISELGVKPSKRIKKENVKAVTADPSQITETITVEGQALIDDSSSKDGKSLKQYSNKRLSRSSETPPRHLPMDIVLNGIDDSPNDEKPTSKNKIFKATNPRKRKEELQEKRQNHFTNVFQRNKPVKRRGRPPKKKSYPTNDELNKEFLLKASLESNSSIEETLQESTIEDINSPPDKANKPIKTKKMREIERLLGDEGAINMLYSVEQKRASGGESKRGVLPSYRRKKKDLILKTKLVKSAVLRLTTNPPLTSSRVSLRGQAPKEGESEESDKSSLRKMSVDSHDSHLSLSSPPPESFSFPAKIVPAEASRIIRRHSSSSNYSSRSNSPRRLSVDGERINIQSPEVKGTEEEIVPSAVSNSKQKQTPHQTPEDSVKKSHDKSQKLSTHKDCANKVYTPDSKSTSGLKKLPTSIKNKSKLPIKVESPRLRGRKRIFSNVGSQNNTELSTSLAAAVEDFAKENKSGGKNIPVETPKKFVTSPVPIPKTVYRKSADVVRTRTPKPSKVYKEITLKRHDKVVEIMITPVSTTLHNSFNCNVLRDLTSVLPGLAKDDNCHIVLITSKGTVFCQGVDFPALVKPTQEERKVAALEMGVAVKEFVKCVAMLARPVVVAVHAPTVGLGVALLPLCDVVLAADHATFHTPYTRLGQVPEGAATLTFPSLLGHSVTSELLFACRKLTASEAQQAGLVTKVLPADNFHEEALTIAKSMASHSAQAMNATKVLLRHGLLAGLETTLMSEVHLLTKHWASAECQANFAAALDSGDYLRAQPPAAATAVPATSTQSTAEVGPQ